MSDQPKPKPPKGCIIAIMLAMGAVPLALVVGVVRLISWISTPSPAAVTRATEVPVSEMASAVPVAPREKPAVTAVTAVDAWVYAQEFVKRGLKSPSTASFGSVFGESQSGMKCCRRQPDSSWRCNGWVDAQNAFGAMLRSDFSVTLKQTDDGGGWELVAGPVVVGR